MPCGWVPWLLPKKHHPLFALPILPSFTCSSFLRPPSPFLASHLSLTFLSLYLFLSLPDGLRAFTEAVLVVPGMFSLTRLLFPGVKRSGLWKPWLLPTPG